MAAKFPETRSELRDCLRQSWQGPITSYADEILRMIAAKVQSSQKKTAQKRKTQHVIFEDVPAASNPEAVAYKQVVTKGDLHLVDGKLPEFDVGKAHQLNDSVFS